MLPREIQAEHWPDRTTYTLPLRPIGAVRFLGLVPMAFAIAFASVPGRMLLSLGHDLFSGGKSSALLWVPIVFVSIFVLVAFVPFTMGLFLLAGRTRLVATRERITVTEIAGPIRRSRKIKVADIERLEFGAASMQGRPEGSAPAWVRQLGGLTAVLRTGKGRLLLIGYPRGWVEAMAEELSSFLRMGGANVQVKEMEALTHDSATAADEAVCKPASSGVRIEPRVNGMVMEIPPAGVRRGSKGLLTFGIIWCLFMAVFTGVAGFANDHNGHPIPWGVWLFIAGFWGIGLSMLAGAVNMGRRRATLTVQSGGLRLDQQGLFGAKSREWQRSQIAAIRVDRSGMEVNNVPILELQIHPNSGKKSGLLAGRSEDELRWLAVELRRALGVPTASSQ